MLVVFTLYHYFKWAPGERWAVSWQAVNPPLVLRCRELYLWWWDAGSGRHRMRRGLRMAAKRSGEPWSFQWIISTKVWWWHRVNQRRERKALQRVGKARWVSHDRQRFGWLLMPRQDGAGLACKCSATTGKNLAYFNYNLGGRYQARYKSIMFPQATPWPSLV